MNKIKLILADTDSRYVDKVAEFINSTLASQARVIAFTKVDLLLEYLSTTSEQTDILLINPAFLEQVKSCLSKVELVLVLAANSGQQNWGEFQAINKFQPGASLLNHMLNLYAKQNLQVNQLVTGSSPTKLIGIYSPAGGVGKTTVSLGLATKLSEFGLAVFCLSLESINSQAAPLNSQGNDAMTHILLSLQDNPQLLPLKAEMYKTRDDNHNFDFFEPPQCFLEQAELSAQLLGVLLKQLRQLGRYDVIIIDMDSALDEKTVTVFAEIDKLILVQVPELVCRYKTETFLSQLRTLGLAEQLGIYPKLVPLLNKYQGSYPSGHNQHGLEPNYHVPLFAELWTYQQEKYAFDAGRNLSNSLAPLAKKII